MPIYKKVNKNFFKKWSPEMAYILGFFAADGYMTVNKFGGQYWCISIIDGELLENIKKTVESEHKISIRKGKNNDKNQYRIQVGNREMCEDLRRLGFHENKIRNLSVSNVPDKFFADFVRGYFDGDGHVWTGWVHKERKTRTYVVQTVFTSCSEKFLNLLKIKLEDFDIENGRTRKEKRGYFRLVYSVKSSLKLYNFMYNSLGTSKLFLNRKKTVFDKYKNMRA